MTIMAWSSMRSRDGRYRWSALLGAVSGLASIVIGLIAGPAPATALTVEEIVSAKGIKAWLVEEHSVPLIAIRFAFLGGAVQEEPGKEGLSGMLTDLLTEGAGDLTAAGYKKEVARLGARLTASSARDAIYMGLETLTSRFGPSAELLRLALVAPRLDAEAVERVRAQRLNDLAIAANEPTRVVVDKLYAVAFSGHAYGRPVDGTPETVARLTREDVKALHGRLFARDVLRVVIVGDITKSAAAEILDTVFGGLPEKAKVTQVTRAEARPLPTPIVVDKDQALATAAFVLPSLTSDHPDFPALQVLNHVIGSGDFDCRLMEELRIKRGLTYSAQTSLLRDSIASSMLGGFATKNENMAAALSVLKDVLAATARDGPTPAQFDNAKRYLTGSFLLDFDTNGKVASSLLGSWIDGDGADYLVTRNQKIERVTLNDVKRVAQQVLKADRLAVTIVGRPKLEK